MVDNTLTFTQKIREKNNGKVVHSRSSKMGENMWETAAVATIMLAFSFYTANPIRQRLCVPVEWGGCIRTRSFRTHKRMLTAPPAPRLSSVLVRGTGGGKGHLGFLFSFFRESGCPVSFRRTMQRTAGERSFLLYSPQHLFLCNLSLSLSLSV